MAVDRKKIFPTSTPTSSRIVMTPINPAHWTIYEGALSKAILGSEGGLCEWSILGESDSVREVYVWALCQFKSVQSRAGSVPAVIYLGENGEIKKVTIPRDGLNYSKDIKTMFPPDVQAKIIAREFDASAAMEQIDARRHSGGPPQIVVLGTPLP